MLVKDSRTYAANIRGDLDFTRRSPKRPLAFRLLTWALFGAGGLGLAISFGAIAL